MSAKADSLTTPTIGIKDQYWGFQAPFSERRLLLVVVDSLLVVLAACAAFFLWKGADKIHFDNNHLSARWHWFPILLSGWWLLAWLNDLYDIPSSVYRILSGVRVAVAGALGFIIFLVVFFLAPQDLSRPFFVYFFLIALPAITLWRWTYATLFDLLPIQHRVLIVGGGERARAIVDALRKTPRVNYHVLGYVEERERALAVGSALNQTSRVTYRALNPVEDGLTAQSRLSDGLPVFGRTADLPRLVTELQVQEIVVATDCNVEKDLFELLVECHGLGAQVSQMPDLYEKFCRSIPIQHIDPMWAMGVMQNLPCRLELAVKRLLDILLVVIGLLALALLFPLVALAIYLESPGPIFYRQVRCGRGGRSFSILKFRTMSPDAEKEGQPRWAIKDDPRVTRVGCFLRKTRIDELPQILNVLRGEMSVVGPRPERPEFVEQLQQEIPFYRTRLMVKPGLTGWAQVHYHYGNCTEDALMKLQYDFYYMRYWSVGLDFYILFRTLAVMLKFKGT
jgi:exopolysaccharide biosynthesis polyprenyl glycosylphosphotransferase